ncbi:MAG TPA: hypothetical protein PLK30_22515 [Blastocatellia bacterium]|nr:hypothetical protein [Blastocatellia bacterium]
MITNRRKVIGGAVVLLITLSSLPHSALGKFVSLKPDVKPQPKVTNPNPSVSARLVARGNQPVLVNGYGAYTGATVLTGATIQTPDGVRATLQLAKLGSFDLSPNAIAVVDFDHAEVTGTLKRGCAVLTTHPDIRGKLVTPDGTSLTTDTVARSSVTACSEETSSNDVVRSNKKSGSSSWIFDLVNPGSMIDMIQTGVFLGANRGGNRCCCCCCCRNPSPSSPNDCGCP